MGPRGGERLHYPDLRYTTERGERVAVELELTSKSRTRRELILSAYGAEPSVDHVLYLVRDRRIGDEIAASARRLGLEDLIHVQRVELADPTRPPDIARSAERSRGRGGGTRHGGSRRDGRRGSGRGRDGGAQR